MVTQALGGVLVAFFSFAGQVPNLKLAELIPKEKWNAAGIHKLTDEEQVVLCEEINSLQQRYRESLTDGVAVIAPSVSTSMKAREIREELKKNEVAFRYAKAILVVVRSALFNPLQHGYNSVGELQRDADGQLNIAGPKYHVYRYSMDDNLRVTQVSHKSFDAE